MNKIIEIYYLNVNLFFSYTRIYIMIKFDIRLILNNIKNNNAKIEIIIGIMYNIKLVY